MNKKLGFVLPALALPFMLVACQSSKEIDSIEVTPKQLVYQVGEVINKEDFDVKVVYSDNTEKKLKTNEWTTKTNFPYRLNTVDRNNGYTSIDVRVGKSKTSYMLGVAPLFMYDTISVGYQDNTVFSVPLLNEKYSLINDVTYDIYDDGSVIVFDTGKDKQNFVKLKQEFSAEQKDSYLWAFLKVGDEKILIDGCTIKAKYTSDNVTFNPDGDVTIQAGAASVSIPTIKGGYIANKLVGNAATSTLTKVTLPVSLTEINDSVFNGSTLLTEVDTSLDTSLTTIGASAFSGCNNADFKKIDIPSSVKSIGDSCFSGCSNLSTLNISSSSELSFIGKDAFKDTNLIYTDSGEGKNNDKYVKAYVDGALNNYYILNELGDSKDKCLVNEYCKFVSADCDVKEEENFNLPEGVEVISRNALSKIDLKTFTIPSTVKIIGKGAFSKVEKTKTETIVLSDYDNWNYIKADGEYEPIKAEKMKDTEEFVKVIGEHDIYYLG